MALLTTNHQSNIQAKLEELERRNQLLEAEIERLRVYKDYAYTDALTEIPNRRFYYERLLQEIARSRRSGSSLTLALVDLDLFKQINDDVGHTHGCTGYIGDSALVQADVMDGCCNHLFCSLLRRFSQCTPASAECQAG